MNNYAMKKSYSIKNCMKAVLKNTGIKETMGLVFADNLSGGAL